MTFASILCGMISFKGPSDFKDNSTSSESSTSSRSVVRTFNLRDEMSKSRKTKPFMRNYTLLENVQLLSVNPKLQSYDARGRQELPVRHFSVHSHRGYAESNPDKKNQDAILSLQDEATKSLVFACMDGHGLNGDPVAEFIKKGLEEHLCSHPLFGENVKQAITETITSIETKLFQDTSIDCDTSGSTLSIAVVRGRKVTVANVGDSRALIITKLENNKFEAIPLSYDHRPDDENEKSRIIAAGGRVFGVKYPDGTTGPERVWLGHIDAPGLAMSRSVGDRFVHTCGVISTPDFIEYEITNNDVALIVASDGLWNVLSDKEVVKHVTSTRETAGAVSLLLREARIRWLTSNDNADDTSIALASFVHDKSS